MNSLQITLSEVEDIASQTGWNEKSGSLGEIKEAVREESNRILQLAADLDNPNLKTTQERVDRGGGLIEASKSAFAPGKIKPHLLFRYAFARDLLKDILVK